MLVPGKVVRFCDSCHDPPINAGTLRIELEALPSCCLQGQCDGTSDALCVLPSQHPGSLFCSHMSLLVTSSGLLPDVTSSHVTSSGLTQGFAPTDPFAWKDLPPSSPHNTGGATSFFLIHSSPYSPITSTKGTSQNSGAKIQSSLSHLSSHPSLLPFLFVVSPSIYHYLELHINSLFIYEFV